MFCMRNKTHVPTRKIGSYYDIHPRNRGEESAYRRKVEVVAEAPQFCRQADAGRQEGVRPSGFAALQTQETGQDW